MNYKKREIAFKISVRKSPGRLTHRWEDISNMDLKNHRAWICGLDSSGSG
jgi:hypothetical protein